MLFLLFVGVRGEVGGHVKELRYGRTSGLDLECRHDELIRIVSERLGYSAGGLQRGRHRVSSSSSSCSPRPMCSVPYSQASWYCRGRSSCRGMPVERRPLHRLTCGSDFTNCLRVEYKCVKSKSVCTIRCVTLTLTLIIFFSLIYNLTHRRMFTSKV